MCPGRRLPCLAASSTHSAASPAGGAAEYSVNGARRSGGLGMRRIGRDSLDGAILLSPANSVNTFRMRMPSTSRTSIVAFASLPYAPCGSAGWGCQGRLRGMY